MHEAASKTEEPDGKQQYESVAPVHAARGWPTRVTRVAETVQWERDAQKAVRAEHHPA